MKKKITLPGRKTSYLTRAILYSAAGVYCLINIKQMFVFFVVFVVIAAYNFSLWFKHKNDLSFMKILEQNLLSDDDEDDEDIPVAYSQMSRKEQKQFYIDYMNQLEEEFADDELDYIDDDYTEEDE